MDTLRDIVDESQELDEEKYDQTLDETARFYSKQEQLLRAQLLKNQITEAEYDQAILDERLDAVQSEFDAIKNLTAKNLAQIASEEERLRGRTDQASLDRLVELADEKKKIEEGLVAATSEFETKKLEIENDRIEATLEAEEKAADKIKEEQEEKLQDFELYVEGITNIIQQGLDIALQYYTSQQDLIAIKLQNDLDALDKRAEESQKNFTAKQDQINRSEVLSAEAKENALAQLEEKRLADEKKIAKDRERLEKNAAREQLEIQRKTAQANLGIAIADLTAQAAIEVAKLVIKSAGNPFNLALIPVVLGGLASAVVTYKGQINAIDAQLNGLGFAEGGFVSGPGTGSSDSIPARLSNGEYVVNAQSTAANLPLLESINSTGGSNSGDMTAVLNELRGEIKQLRQKPVKAYVVTEELTEANRTEDYIERRAQL